MLPRSVLRALAVALAIAVGACQFSERGLPGAAGVADAGVAVDGPIEGIEPDAQLSAQSVDVESVEVVGPEGGAPVKGEPLTIRVAVRNTGIGGGAVRVRPLLSSERFTDFDGVLLPEAEGAVPGGAVRTIELVVGPLLEDGATGARYALGTGDYRVVGVEVSVADTGARDESFAGGEVTVGPSDAIFTAVVYDQGYLDQLGYNDSAEQFMREATTRHAQVFEPGPGSEGGAYDDLPGGFDELVGIHQQFLAVGGLTASEAAGGFCEQIGAYARTALGLPGDWDIDHELGYTDVDHHGFDLLVGLTPELTGTAACGWLGIQVSGLEDDDLSVDRAQLGVAHATGHLFGADHCQPLQGYVMCSGELHPRYQGQGILVWHVASAANLSNPWQ